ncbi:hypothetical protein VTH82DRAFT_3033 [Thermothelomyces myriococcoides]
MGGEAQVSQLCSLLDQPPSFDAAVCSARAQNRITARPRHILHLKRQCASLSTALSRPHETIQTNPIPTIRLLIPTVVAFSLDLVFSAGCGGAPHHHSIRGKCRKHKRRNFVDATS